jgi:fructokinase
MTYVTIGELVVDWLAERPGQSLLEPGAFYRCLGGNSSNVAIGLARLGSSVRLLGKLGDDVDGHYLSAVLSAEGIDLSFVIKDKLHHTAQCYCLTGVDGEHYFHNWPEVNAAQSLAPDDIKPQALTGCAFLHATGISFIAEPRRSAVRKAIDLAIAAGMIVSFDTGFSGGSDEQSKSIDAVLRKAQIIKFNYPELLFWSGKKHKSVRDLARALFAKYKPIVLVATLGAEGSLIVTEGAEFACPPIAVQAKDGIGAGDAYMAGLLNWLGDRLGSKVSPTLLSGLSEDDWLAAGRFANACGAMATTSVGAIAGLPRRAEVEALLKERAGIP